MYYVFSLGNGKKEYFRDFAGDKVEYTKNSAIQQVNIMNSKKSTYTVYDYEMKK